MAAAEYFDAYHAAVDTAIRTRMARPGGGDVVLLSVHSFTPIWNGRMREMDMGVLFDNYEPIAQRLREELTHEGFGRRSTSPTAPTAQLRREPARHRARSRLSELEVSQNTRRRALARSRRVSRAR